MKFRLTIARAMVLFGLVTTAGLAAVVFTGIYALGEVKVGGPLYNKIKLGNDLVADILPPPEYVIEAYLEATLALNDPAALATHRERLVQLKKEYDERQEFWKKSDLDPALKAKLVESSHREVQRFWNAIEQTFLPALAKATPAAAAKSYAEITAAYPAHRALIDEIVKKTNDDNAATEAGRPSASPLSRSCCGASRRLVFLMIWRRLARRRSRRHSADDGDDRCHARLAGGELDDRDSLARIAQGRDRRHGPRRPGLQGQCRARSGHGIRAGRAAEAEGRAGSQGGDACRSPTDSSRRSEASSSMVSSASSDIEGPPAA